MRLIHQAAALSLVCVVTAGCSSAGGASAEWTAAGAPPEEEGALAVQGDVRLVLFQARNAITMILVNAGHSALGSPEGQLAIAMGNPHQPYKVLSRVQMGALLQSLNSRGLGRVATPFESGDERYFEARAVGSERYRGMLLIEQDGQRRKALGFRPSGRDDLPGQDAYRTFTDLKMLFWSWWDSQSVSSLPSAVPMVAPPVR